MIAQRSAMKRTQRAAPAEDCAVAKGTILVMDDEETIREVLGAMLAAGGYGVVFARDGVEAIELYRRAHASGRPFAGVIMDLKIPGGMGGREAIKHLLEIDPDVRAVVSSGYSQDPILADFKEHGFCGVLSKPFRAAQLFDVLSAVLA